ncbi:PREDICTED: probable WRKY transcription factor 49 [Camelina sativa]|uniref:Probable WRKY transcription factor 49 n=1 Tax=Camelina sativa TaxID=90675 RepID=A0ABM0Y249_CAMSA|nr:PREDICTED: probable WRKY transcription factor 49 [Camelina sativa]
MAEEELSEWTRTYDNNAVEDLFVNDPSLFFLPQEQHHRLMPNEDSITNTFYSLPVNSGPRIQDMANALAVVEPQTHPVQEISITTALSKADRYTLKVKSYTNGMCDDGYKWRKYGQKTIKNSPNPRSYYKCTNPICNAKKQVERSIDESNTYIITYEGFHFHYAYPFFPPVKTHRPNKKARTLKHDAQEKLINKPSQTQEESKKAHLIEHAYQNHSAYRSQEYTPLNLENELFLPVDHCRRHQGLLEDVVAPAKVTTPARDSVLAASWSSLSTYTSSSGSSSRTCSPPLSPSSLCWSPNVNIGFSDEILDLIGYYNF